MGTRTWSKLPALCLHVAGFCMEIMALPPPLGSIPLAAEQPWSPHSVPGTWSPCQKPQFQDQEIQGRTRQVCARPEHVCTQQDQVRPGPTVTPATQPHSSAAHHMSAPS